MYTKVQWKIFSAQYVDNKLQPILNCLEFQTAAAPKWLLWYPIYNRAADGSFLWESDLLFSPGKGSRTAMGLLDSIATLGLLSKRVSPCWAVCLPPYLHSSLCYPVVQATSPLELAQHSHCWASHCAEGIQMCYVTHLQHSAWWGVRSKSSGLGS